MRRPIVLALTTGLLVLAVPADANVPDVRERNAALILAMLGEQDLSAPVTLLDGRSMTLGAAVEDAAARAGSVDLAALASGAVVGPWGDQVGDVWVLEAGRGPCTIAPQMRLDWPLPPAPLHGQLWIYDGWIGSMSTTHGAYTFVIGWTTKTVTAGVDTAGFHAWGISDMYCFRLAGGDHFAFPFIDGIAGEN